MSGCDDLRGVYGIFLKEHYAIGNDDFREEGNIVED